MNDRPLTDTGTFLQTHPFDLSYEALYYEAFQGEDPEVRAERYALEQACEMQENIGIALFECGEEAASAVQQLLLNPIQDRCFYDLC